MMMQSVMSEAKKLCFSEGEFLVKTLESEEELREAYRLRHRVFAEELKWVPETGSGLETDIYDAWSHSIGVFSDWGRLLGIVRMTQAPVPFMLESEFSACLVGSHRVRKELDTAEITRLAVDPRITDRSLSTKVMCTVIKGAYQWCLAHEVRFTYIVVEKRLLRALRLMGWPCQTIGEPVALPPAQAVSVASLIDLDEFRSNGAGKRPEALRWFSSIDAQSPARNGRMPMSDRTLSRNFQTQGEAA